MLVTGLLPLNIAFLVTVTPDLVIRDLNLNKDSGNTVILLKSITQIISN